MGRAIDPVCVCVCVCIAAKRLNVTGFSGVRVTAEDGYFVLDGHSDLDTDRETFPGESGVRLGKFSPGCYLFTISKCWSVKSTVYFSR